MKRRIALVFWSASYGGAETYGLSLVPSFQRRGIDVSVIFICKGGPLEARLRAERIPYAIVGVNRGLEIAARPWRLARTLDAFPVDAVVLPTSGFLVAVIRFAGFWGPAVVVEHGDVLQLPRLSGFRRARHYADRLIGAPFASRIVVVSDYIRRAVERLPHATTVSTIPNGVDLGRFSPASDPRRDVKFRIGAASRLIPGKGIEVLLRALQAMDLGRPWECVIAGDGPERNHLEQLADRLGVSDHVRFTGWVEDMVAFWRSCDVAVAPSFEFIESFGMTAAEAMACGVPVIASMNGGLSEVVSDGRSGMLVKPGDAQSIRQAIHRYASNPTLCREHGAAARLRCESTFDVRDRADRYLDLLGW